MNRREALAALVALPEVSRISVAKPEPDDVLVVECDAPISQGQATNIRAQLGQIWPNRKIAIFTTGVRIRFAKQ